MYAQCNVSSTMNSINYSKIKFNAIKKAELDATMRSWRIIYDATSDMPDDEPSLAKLVDMLVYEMHNDAPRAMILVRLHMRINRMRQRIEYREIMNEVGMWVRRSPAQSPRASIETKPVKKVKRTSTSAQKMN